MTSYRTGRSKVKDMLNVKCQNMAEFTAFLFLSLAVNYLRSHSKPSGGAVETSASLGGCEI